MGTRAVIARTLTETEGGFKGVYHHWDGYPDNGLGCHLWALLQGQFRGDVDDARADDHARGGILAMKYFVTYLTSPQVDPDEAAPEGSVTVEADTYEAAAVLALALPLPDRADREQVHVSPEDLGMDARCVFVPLKGEAK